MNINGSRQERRSAKDFLRQIKIKNGSFNKCVCPNPINLENINRKKDL